MRQHWDHARSVTGVRILVSLGEEQGMDRARCLRRSGIDEAQLQTPGAMVEAWQELQVASNLLEALGPDYPLGMMAGARSHATSYGIWGFALLASASVREAIHVGLRYLDIVSVFCRIRARDTQQAMELIGEDDALPESLRAFLVERDAATVHTLVRDMRGTPPELAFLHFRRPQPGYYRALADHFGCMPHFGQTENCYALSARALDVRLPQADPLTLQSCEQECQKLMARHQARAGFSNQVRGLLFRRPGRFPAMTEVAGSLAMTPRSLRRRLAEEGTTFEALRDEVRAALADELLRETSLNVEQVADRLGYAEMSCFSRAFKRWYGISPRAFRKDGALREGALA